MSNVRTDPVQADGDEALLRIGELARRCGIEPATLRAWERRYGVVDPVRGTSGYRLYSADDERRVRSMAQLVASGVAPAQAAARVRARSDAARGNGSLAAPADATAREALLKALLAFDAEEADRILDRAIATLSTEAVLGGIILPVLRDVGTMWAGEEADVGQEHFASELLRGRMLGMARGWGGGSGPRAVLACPSGEHHDLGLMAFGLALRLRGWRISFLGGDTPGEALLECTARLRPDAVVVFSRDPDRMAGIEADLAGVASRSRLLLAGEGAEPVAGDVAGAGVLSDGPVEAVVQLAA